MILLSGVTERLRIRAFRREFHRHFPAARVVPVRVFDLSKVQVGDYSYGWLDVRTFSDPIESLKIGRFCSIADGACFLLGGNHRMSTVSTYSFGSVILGDEPEDFALSRGPIIVEDDVWIGTRAVILSGVRIGQGSVVGAGSVVGRDVPAYSIVAGNPAQVIKMRFGPEIVRELMAWADYSHLNDERIGRMRDLLRMDVSVDTLPLIRQLFVDTTPDVPALGGLDRDTGSEKDGHVNR